MIRKIRKFAGLSFEEKILVFQVFFLLIIFRPAVYFLSLKYLKKIINLFLDKNIKNSENVGDLFYKIDKIILSIEQFLPWKVKCLEKSIINKIIASRRGIEVKVIFGVNKDGKGNLIAHAWIENYIVKKNAEEFNKVYRL